MIGSIPGVNASTDDVTGLADGNYNIRGFSGNEIGITVNGAPISDSGSYAVFATEYGDTENYGDITVEQGIPDVDQPDSGRCRRPHRVGDDRSDARSRSSISRSRSARTITNGRFYG